MKRFAQTIKVAASVLYFFVGLGFLAALRVCCSYCFLSAGTPLMAHWLGLMLLLRAGGFGQLPASCCPSPFAMFISRTPTRIVVWDWYHE